MYLSSSATLSGKGFQNCTYPLKGLKSCIIICITEAARKIPIRDAAHVRYTYRAAGGVSFPTRIDTRVLAGASALKITVRLWQHRQLHALCTWLQFCLISGITHPTAVTVLF